MQELRTTNTASETRLTWIEPEIRELDVSETATGYDNRGADNNYPGTVYPDCTKS